MKSLPGRIFCETTYSSTIQQNRTGLYFVPATKGNNGKTVRTVVDFRKSSSSFGAKATVGDVVKIKKHHKYVAGTEATITKIKIRGVFVLIEAEIAGENLVFDFWNLSLPSIF